MGTHRDANWSDLDGARAISRRLQVVGQLQATTRGESYVRFSLAPLDRGIEAALPQAIASAQEDASPSRLWNSESMGSLYWNELLEVCVAAARAEGAECAFAVDGQGLAIASVGGTPTGDVELVGSRLALIFEQAERMELIGDSTGAILVEFKDRWLAGLHIVGSRGETIIVGVVARDALGPQTRETIARVIGEVLLRA